jgi:hypothetical protein
LDFKKVKYFLISLLIFVLFVLQSGLYAQSQRHPYLILTPERVKELKLASQTTHSEIWNYCLELAGEFGTNTVPVSKNAHNKHRFIGDTMPVLGLAYLITNDSQYIKMTERWVSALISVPDWQGSQNLGRSSWIVGCALIYDWLYDELESDLKILVRHKLEKEATVILKENSSHRALSNHLLIETTALGIAGFVLNGYSDKSIKFIEQADQWAQYIINHAPQDGSWGEGVQYWQYGLGYFLRFTEAARTSGFKNYYKEYSWLEKTGFFPIYFSLPQRPTEVINFSDCGSKRYIPAFLTYLPASIYKNGFYQQYANQVFATRQPHKFTWLDFIYYDPEIVAEDINQLPTLKHFSDNDFVIMRSGWDKDATTIGFRCGPAPGHRNQKHPDRLASRGFGPGHGHPDINSFCIYSKGEWLAIDPGYTKLKETRNHNTIIVNGHGQAGAGAKWLDFMAFEARTPAPAILRVESNDVYDYVLGDAGNIYVDEARLKHFRRHLFFLKPNIVIIADDLTAKDESRFEWLLNAFEKIIHISSDQFEISRNSVRLMVNKILPKASQAEISERKIKASDVKGETDVDSGMMKTLNLSVSGVNNAKFLIVLSFLKDENSIIPDISFVNNRLKINHEDRSWQVLYLDEVENKGDPVLVLENPDVRQIYYRFIRNDDQHQSPY